MSFDPIKNKKGFTLLEIVVSVSLFAFTMISATQIFRVVIDGQRDAIASQDMQESIRYTFERIAKEIRMANKSSSSTCTTIPDKVYYASPGEDELHFLNYKDECIKYFVSNGRLMMTWDPPSDPAKTMPLTPKKLKVNDLRFEVYDSVGDEQSRVTMLIDMQVDTRIKKHQQRMKMQTTISSRYYE